MRGPSPVTTLNSSPLPARPAKSDANFQAVLANASTEEISAIVATSPVANTAANPAANTATKADIAILNEDAQHGTQAQVQSQVQAQPLPSLPTQGAPAQNEAAAHATDKGVVVSGDSKKAPEKRSAKSQEDAPAANNAATKSSPATAALLLSAGLPAIPQAIPQTISVQPVTPPLQQNTSGTQRPIAPLKQPDTVPVSAVAVNDAPNEAAVSNAMPFASAAPPAEAASVQAMIEMPPAISVPANTKSAAESTAEVVTGSSQPVTRAAAKQTFDAPAPIHPIATDAAGAATIKTAPTSSGQHNAPSHDSEPNQKTQSGDASQPAAALPRAIDNSQSPVQGPQTIVPPAPVREVASPVQPSAALTDMPRTTEHRVDPGSSHPETGAVAATPDVKSATLMQAFNGTEMRVGMHSSDFGDISIRTFMSTQAVRTQISLDHSELSQAISTHVSSMQTKLGDELGIHASIEVNQLGSSLSGNAEQSSQRQYGSSTGSMQPQSAANLAAVDVAINMEMPVVVSNGHQLDIRA